MKIFIGSSTQERRRAARVAKSLRDVGHKTFPWWDTAKVFRAGDYTLDRLIELSDICDGAVLIFGADDELWYTGSGRRRKKVAKARDNVVLEYGLFVGKHGRENVAILTNEGVELPSDVKGITYIKGHYQAQLKRTFSRPMVTPEGSEDFHVFSDRPLTIRSAGRPPDSWASRSLYVGDKAALYWQEVEDDPDYAVARGSAALVGNIKDICSRNIQHEVSYVVSFGPGVGSLDKQIIPLLPGAEYKSYVPVDINFYLMNMAAKRVDDSDPNTFVPFAIHGDFEEGMSAIATMVNKRAKRGRIFLMLGGTFGNIEHNETTFLRGLRNCMADDDYFLLDTFVKSARYDSSADSFRDLGGQPESVKRLLAYALHRRSGLPEEECESNLLSHIDIEEVEDTNSHVKETEGFSFVATNNGKPVLFVRRYDRGEFSRYLERRLGFSILGEKYSGTSNPAVDRGVFLLRRHRV